MAVSFIGGENCKLEYPEKTTNLWQVTKQILITVSSTPRNDRYTIATTTALEILTTL
jgi:hypothetical protein